MTEPLYKDLKRTPGWRARLAQAIIIDRDREFGWGDKDCFLGLIVPAIYALTEFDIGEPFRNRYSDAVTARQVLDGVGFSDLGDAAAAYFPEIPVAFAHIGDLVTVSTGLEGQEGLGTSLGIVNGERITVLAHSGFVALPMRRATRAFRVG